MPSRNNSVPAENVALLYKSGESVNAISRSLSIGRGIVYRLLNEQGITLRTSSEQELIKWSRMTTAQREAQTANAHTACKGRKRSSKERMQGAQTRFTRQLHIGKWEAKFAELLNTAGVEFSQQTPCSSYNIDFTLTKYRVAVEIISGGKSRQRTLTYCRKRLKRILDEWHLVEVQVGSGYGQTIAPAVVEKLIAFGQKTRADKPSPGQYWVIRSDGKTPDSRLGTYRVRRKDGTYHFRHMSVANKPRAL